MKISTPTLVLGRSSLKDTNGNIWATFIDKVDKFHTHQVIEFSNYGENAVRIDLQMGLLTFSNGEQIILAVPFIRFLELHSVWGGQWYMSIAKAPPQAEPLKKFRVSCFINQTGFVIVEATDSHAAEKYVKGKLTKDFPDLVFNDDGALIIDHIIQLGETLQLGKKYRVIKERRSFLIGQVGRLMEIRTGGRVVVQFNLRNYVTDADNLVLAK